MGKQLTKLRRDIDSGVFTGDALSAAQSLYKTIQKRKDTYLNILNQAINEAKNIK